MSKRKYTYNAAMTHSLRIWRAAAIFGAISCAAALFAAPAGAADKTLRVAMTTIPPSHFNPFRYTGIPGSYTWSAVFDGLTAFDDTGALMPHLAVSWQNTGPLTWVFKLREGVTFSNGAPFTADAVVASVEFLASEAAITEGVARMMSFLKSARAINAHTVEITTKVPTPLLPRFVTQLYAVEPATFRRLGITRFARAPVGTGPFMVEDIAPERVLLKAFTGSWRAPKVDRLEIRALADQPTRAVAVEAKQTDIALQLGPEEVAGIVAGGGRKVVWKDAQIWAYNFIGGRHPAVADVRVREALNIAVDRATIIKQLLEGATEPATQPAPSNVFGFNPALPPIPYDPARAKDLLKAAGWEKGFKLVLEATSGSGPSDDSINLIMAQYLGEIGVDVEFRPISSNQIISNSVDGGWKGDGFAIAYSYSPTQDALRALDTHSCLSARPWYCNQAVMPLIKAAQVEFDPAKSLKLRQDIMAFYRNDWASIFMFQQARFAGTSGKVAGLKVVNNQISYDQITLN